MKIDIVVPTYKRPEKLIRCLDSILAQTHKNWECCVIVNGGDERTYEVLNHYSSKDSRIWCKSPGTNYVVDSWNYYFRNFTFSHPTKYQDVIAWIVDDVELFPNYLEELAKSMKANFPDLDGVVGAKQICPGREDYTYKDFGQILIGRKFIERYKDVDYQVCCLEYKHFHQDHELWEYAHSMNKFKKCETAVLKHYHPAFLTNEMDSTHPLVRGTIKKQDDEKFRERQKKGLIWGKTWDFTENNDRKKM